MKAKFKRYTYSIVKNAINNNTIPVLFGLRRIGKTTILLQLEQEFDNSLYIDWSDAIFNKMSFNEFYVFIEAEADKNNLLLFDEVQTIPNWHEIIFSLYNKYTAKGKCNFAVTGSSLMMKKKKLGLDRVERIYIDSLSFGEYLKFSNLDKNEDSFEYFFGRGFPTYINYDFEKNGFENITNKVLRQIVEEDLRHDYPMIDKNRMFNVLNHIGTRIFGIVNETAIGNEVGLDKKTIASYINVFEKAHILKKVYRVDQDGRLGKKQKYKAYLNPHFYIWLNNMSFSQIKHFKPEILGHIVESYWIHRKTSLENNSKRYYFLQNTKNKNKEIDFVVLYGVNNPFKEIHELKYKNTFILSNFSHMHSIKADKKYIWTKNLEKNDYFDSKSILDL